MNGWTIGAFFIGLATGIIVFILCLKFVASYIIKFNKDYRLANKKEIDNAVSKAKKDIKESFGVRERDDE